MIKLQGSLLFALIVVAWLTAGGMAVRSVSRIWLRHWADRRLRGAGAALTYLERPQRLLVAAGTGVAATLLFAGMVIGSRTQGGGVIGAVIGYAAVVILLGQLLPRAIARRFPSAIAPAVLPALQVMELIATPLANAGAWAARPLMPRRDEIPGPTDRDAIQDLLREGELEGIGERDEIAIISGVVEFSEKRVRDVMTQRADVFALARSLDAHAFAEQVARAGYSRVPIYDATLDDSRGMVHAFDVLKSLGETVPRIRPVASSDPDSPCNELLFRMLRERLHLALVRDASGAVVGLVTLEDLLEELVGDIRDEHDEPAPPVVPGETRDPQSPERK